METIILSDFDRNLIASLTAELKRHNDLAESRGVADTVVSVSEAARLTGRTRQTISRKIREGQLKKISRGGVSGILLSELNIKI